MRHVPLNRTCFIAYVRQNFRGQEQDNCVFIHQCFAARSKKMPAPLFALQRHGEINLHEVTNKKMARLIRIASCVWLFSCVCVLLSANLFAARHMAEAEVKAAGCFIPTPRGVVLGIHPVFRDIRIPFGSRKTNETARQTATRETLEETGLDVAVGPVLQTFENDTALLFHCVPKTPIDDYSQLRPIDTLETSEVIVVDPGTMLNHDGRKIKNSWRVPADRDLLIRLFREYQP